ncbi:hypothetical protein CSOJ01_00284 [Colletotrichum sojae]|uniref:Uncharacterized protein n=1 Tax=Colletotrichum sojae TaxID=2175907 RepID=A0A8H6JY98_9PEZI|nr:hypothetical protein CSOJ01_00284 [Colletotrichum sojae]
MPQGIASYRTANPDRHGGSVKKSDRGFTPDFHLVINAPPAAAADEEPEASKECLSSDDHHLDQGLLSYFWVTSDVSRVPKVDDTFSYGTRNPVLISPVSLI